MTCSSIARRPTSRRSECTAYRLTRAYMAPPPPLQRDAWTLQLCRTFMYVGKSWVAAHGGARRSIGRAHFPTSETSSPFETKCSRSGMNPDYRSRASVYLPESMCEAKGGWVAKSKWLIAISTHHLEKSAPGFVDTSIDRLFYWQLNLRESGAARLRNRSS